jgi:hypothetical protein
LFLVFVWSGNVLSWGLPDAPGAFVSMPAPEVLASTAQFRAHRLELVVPERAAQCLAPPGLVEAVGRGRRSAEPRTPTGAGTDPEPAVG